MGTIEHLLIKNVNIIDCINNTPIYNACIYVIGNRISHISRDNAFGKLLDVPSLDACGKYIIPGLMDLHVHLMGIADLLPLFLSNGITTVRDLGSHSFCTLQLKQRVALGEVSGPRIFTSGYMLEGAQPYNPFISISLPEWSEQVVKRHLAQVDCVKVYKTIDASVLHRVAKMAHAKGLPVIGHLGNKNTAMDAGRLGIDEIQHVSGMAEVVVKTPSLLKFGDPEGTNLNIAWTNADDAKIRDLVGVMIERSVALNPTLIVNHTIACLRKEPGINNGQILLIPKAVRSRLLHVWDMVVARRFMKWQEKDFDEREAALEKIKDFVRYFKSQGGKVLAGTDTPYLFTLPGSSLHAELELLVQSGLSPYEAIQSATIHSAEALRRETDLGSIENGKLADLVIIDDNPLGDIGATRRVSAVIKDGKPVFSRL